MPADEEGRVGREAAGTAGDERVAADHLLEETERGGRPEQGAGPHGEGWVLSRCSR